MAQDYQNHIDRLTTMIAEGRIIRDAYHSTDDRGRETACLLSAFDASFDEPEKCPADLMPAWLAYLTPSMDDYGSDAAWAAMVKRYGVAACGWDVLDDAAWRRCLARTMIAAL